MIIHIKRAGQARQLCKGHQFTQQPGKIKIEIFRVELGSAGAMGKPGLVTVKQLQHHKFRHIRDAALRRRANTVCQIACPSANGPLYLFEINTQFLTDLNILAGGDKIVIQRQGAVGMAIADTAKRERNIGAHIFCTAHNARRQLSQRQCSRVTFF